MMKTKTLLMVAGAGVLVYWLWKKNKSADSQYDMKPMGGSDLEKYAFQKNAKTKEECELHGGRWADNAPVCVPDMNLILNIYS